MQLESLSKSLQSATRAWHSRLEALQGTATQHSQKILEYEKVSPQLDSARQYSILSRVVCAARGISFLNCFGALVLWCFYGCR